MVWAGPKVTKVVVGTDVVSWEKALEDDKMIEVCAEWMNDLLGVSKKAVKSKKQ